MPPMSGDIFRLYKSQACGVRRFAYLNKVSVYPAVQYIRFNLSTAMVIYSYRTSLQGVHCGESLASMRRSPHLTLVFVAQ